MGAYRQSAGGVGNPRYPDPGVNGRRVCLRPRRGAVSRVTAGPVSAAGPASPAPPGDLATGSVRVTDRRPPVFNPV